MKSGTWAYLGHGKDETKQYLFWTSVNISTVDEKTKIPVIIRRADGKYYVSESTTAKREGTDIKTTYMTISDHLSPSGYQEITDKGRKCDSLQEAYDVYVKKITEDYSNFKDTLPKN